MPSKRSCLHQHGFQMAALTSTRLHICQTPKQTAEMSPSHCLLKYFILQNCFKPRNLPPSDWPAAGILGPDLVFLFLQHISVKCTNSFDSNVLVHEINQTIWFNRHVWGIYLYVWWLFLSTKCPRYILVVDMSFPAHLRDCNVWDLETLGQTSLRNQLLVCYLHALELPQLWGPCICPPNSDSTQPCSSHLRCCTVPNISHLATRGLLHKILN